MALPKIDLPLFELEIPSTGKKAKYRAFSVKEEKILLIAQESNDIDQVVNSVKQILNNCLIKVDVDQLAIFDLEYIMMHIRSKSVNNTIKFGITDPDTNERIDLEFDINDLTIKRDPEHTRLIQIDESNTLVMQYPTFDQLKSLKNFANDTKEKQAETLAQIMFDCVNSVQSGDEVYKLKDFSEKEVFDFFDSLPSSAIKKMERFFETMPVLRHEVKYTNKNGDNKTFVIEGMESFFL